MLVQCYGIQNGIKTSALFISIRRLGESAGPNILYETNISLPYVFVCLISASSGNKFSDQFFVLCAAIIAWMLLTQRTKHFSIITWLASIIFVIFFSYLTQNGLQRLQNDSGAFFLEQLEKEADSRLPGETLTKWVKRILPVEKTKRYFDVIDLHNRYRFNPESDKQQEKRSLMDAVSRLTQHKV